MSGQSITEINMIPVRNFRQQLADKETDKKTGYFTKDKMKYLEQIASPEDTAYVRVRVMKLSSDFLLRTL
jgi:hypothetical protein